MRIRLHLFKKLKFYRQLSQLRKQGDLAGNIFPFGKKYPFYNDADEQSGEASGHYFHQDLLVARKIFHNSPEKHVDIGSRIDGFVAHVASFRKIEVLDVRKLSVQIPNIIFTQADLMSPEIGLANYTDSLSSLHAIEHFGLGRYGDPLAYDGYLKGLNNIHKILKTAGKFYFSVPIGPQRIEFNAHRVFSIKYLFELFSEKYKIDNFSFVDDDGDLHYDCKIEDGLDNNFSCHYGCGIFEMTKT